MYHPFFNKITAHSNKEENLFEGMSTLIDSKIKENKESAMKHLMMNSESKSRISEPSEPMDLRLKGKVLMTLKQYPRLNFQKSLWHWYLNSTAMGEEMFHRVADSLVLYTNINRTSAFYRLLSGVRRRQKKVPPRVKRMTIMLFLYARIYAERNMKEIMNILKRYSFDSRR